MVEVHMTPQQLLLQAASDPDLKMERVAVELGRLALLRGFDGEKVDIAGVLEGMARIKQAGGAHDAVEELRRFFTRQETADADAQPAPVGGDHPRPAPGEQGGG